FRISSETDPRQPEDHDSDVDADREGGGARDNGKQDRGHAAPSFTSGPLASKTVVATKAFTVSWRFKTTTALSSSAMVTRQPCGGAASQAANVFFSSNKFTAASSMLSAMTGIASISRNLSRCAARDSAW